MQLAHNAETTCTWWLFCESNLGSSGAAPLITIIIINIKVWQTNEGVSTQKVTAAGIPGA